MKTDKIGQYIVWILTALSLVGLLFLSSCLKKEPLWQLPPAGDETIDAIDMGETYETTVFYQFATRAKYQRNINSWHLAFESSATGWHIKINGGANVQVYNTHLTNFAQSYSVPDPSLWLFDWPSGNLDSTAIGDWRLNNSYAQSKGEVYIADLGLAANHQYKKFQLQNVTDTSYSIVFADMNSDSGNSITITKSANSQFTYFNFLLSGTVDYEPASEDYDISFTKYKHVFVDSSGVTPYIVTGVLTNPNSAAKRLYHQNFDALSYDTVKNIVFPATVNEIGYDWKTYDFDANKYSIDTNNLYVVKDSKGTFWAMQFIDFYNSSGIKGSPKFRFKRL